MADIRIDTIENPTEGLRSPYFAPQGHLRFDGYATRIGVFQYHELQKDGTIKTRHELRHPDQVFDSASLNTINGIPITLLHPEKRQLVTPENFGELGTGTVGDDVDIINPYIRLSGNIQRSDAIEAVKDGIRELSLGYTCRSVPESGEWTDPDGKKIKYDHRQYDIVYNHLAIVPKGRAGSNVKINFDASDWNEEKNGKLDSVLSSIPVVARVDKMEVEETIETTSENQKTIAKETGIKFDKTARTLKVDGIDHHLDDDGFIRIQADPIIALTNKLDALSWLQYRLDDMRSRFQVATVEELVDKISEQFDTVEKLSGQIAVLEENLKTSSVTTDSQDKTTMDVNSEEFKNAVNARVALVLDAKQILGSDVNLDDKSSTEINKLIVTHHLPEMKLDGLSDQVIEGMALGAKQILLRSDSTESLKKAVEKTVSTDSLEPEIKTDAATEARKNLTNWRNKRTRGKAS